MSRMQRKVLVMLKPTLLVVLFASSIVACNAGRPPVIALAGPAAATASQMTVAGKATLQVDADRAVLAMTISADADTPGAAARAAVAKRAAAVAAFSAQGITGPDLKLSLVSVTPVNEAGYDVRWPQRHISGYRAEIGLTITTRQLDKIGDLMQVGTDAGVTYASTEFQRSDLPELKKHVRDLAMAAARAKANQLAAGLDITLGPVTSVSEGTGGDLWGNQFSVSNMVEAPRSSGAGVVGATQSLTLEITLVYQLAATT